MKAILTFHSIDDSPSVLSFPTSRFKSLLAILMEESVPIVSLPELLSRENGVVLTFDDGMASVRKNALPLLQDAGVPSHLFLTTSTVGGENDWPTQPAGAVRFEMMDWDDIDACINGGMTVESHTHTHPYLTRCSEQAIVDECATADSLIEQRTGRRPSAFAYPYGDFDSRVADIVSSQYDFAVTTSLDFVTDKITRNMIPRIDTFYLQRPWQIRNFTGPAMLGYIAFRRILRRLRGSR